MLERILICPAERPAVAFLAQSVPLVALPVLGEPLITYWLESLALAGVKEVLVLATDRPESVRSVVGDGSRWGMRVQVQAEMRELTPGECVRSLAGTGHDTVLDPARDVVTLDHLPGALDHPLFQSYRSWFEGVRHWMPQPVLRYRLRLREIEPQVWCGRRTRISSGAKLVPPCWLGDHVQVGPDTIIGPDAILEERVVVDSASEVRSSIVGPETFVGALTRIEHSIAWGNTLIDWQNGSCTEVPDPFLLSALIQRPIPPRAGDGRLRRAIETLGAWPRLLASLLRNR